MRAEIHIVRRSKGVLRESKNSLFLNISGNEKGDSRISIEWKKIIKIEVVEEIHENGCLNSGSKTMARAGRIIFSIY